MLWQTVRDLTLWARTAPEKRAELFTAEAAEERARLLHWTRPDEALAPVLRELAELLSRPAEVDSGRLARASRLVMRWAESRGATATALEYAQATALTLPDDAAAAYRVGLLARRAAQYGRAESWFRRAVMLARQAGDWNSYALAFVGLGNLYLQRGNLPTARKLHIRARRASRRHGFRGVEGMALHDLFIISSSTGQQAEAEDFAASALRAYGAGHARLPILAHDVAYAWLEQGNFARALPVFEATVPHMRDTGDRLHAVADIARAAGALGNRPRFETAWEDAMEMVGLPEALAASAQALCDLARGAASLGEWERAEAAAEQALEVANARGENKIRFTAEALLASVRSERVAARPVAPEITPEVAETPRTRWLAEALVDRLTASVA